MEIIKSLENKKIKNLAKLLIKKYRDQEDIFLVNGEHLVLEAYKNKYLQEIICTEDTNLSLDIPTTYVTYEIIKKLSEAKTPQTIIGVCKKIKEKNIGNKILLLDDIQDPGNLGTIIRSSVAFHIDTIVLSPKTVDLYNDKVLRSSEGMIFNINIIKRDLPSFTEELKKKNYKIYGTNVNGGKVVSNINLEKQYAIIVGNEGRGVDNNLLNMCDEHFYIPMDESCESLNVGVATSIILYELDKDN